MEKFDDINSSGNAIGLLQLIDNVCSSTDGTKHKYLQAFFTLKNVLNFGQTPSMTTSNYYNEFNLLVKIAEKNNATFYFPKLTKAKATKEDKDKSKERLLAIIFIMNSDNNRYAKYKEDLSNSFASHKDVYPTTLQAAFSSLDLFKFNPSIYTRANHESTKQMRTPDESDSTPSHSFFQQAGTGSTQSRPNTSSTATTDEDKETTQVTYYKCDRPGHISPACTYNTKLDGTLITSKHPQHPEPNYLSQMTC